MSHLFASKGSQKFDSSNDSQNFSLFLASYRAKKNFIC